PLSGVELDLAPRGDRVEITARVRTRGVTGVEMEALTAASVAALTVYDMIKAVDHLARIDGIEVLAKSGGKSGDWHRRPTDAPETPDAMGEDGWSGRCRPAAPTRTAPCARTRRTRRCSPGPPRSSSPPPARRTAPTRTAPGRSWSPGSRGADSSPCTGAWSATGPRSARRSPLRSRPARTS